MNVTVGPPVDILHELEQLPWAPAPDSLQSRMLGTVASFKLLFSMAINKLDFNQFLGRGVYLSKVPKSHRERNTMTQMWTVQSEGARPMNRAQSS